MRKKVFIRQKLLLFLSLLLSLSACGQDTQDKTQQGRTTLVLAAFDNNAYLRKQVELYNQTHADYQIEIQMYERSEQMEEDGVLKLQREIVSGKGPDLIDFGSGYTTSDIVGEYTEDLFSYLESENQDIYFENVLQAFSYGESLRAVPLGFIVNSFAGKQKNLGGRSSWTVAEMIECYSGQKEERILYPGETKKAVLGSILAGSMEYYMDWETGKCDFSGEAFQAVLEFCNSFPERLEITEDYSVKQTFLEDKALLLPVSLGTVYDICKNEAAFDEQEITYIGFPVEGICGNILEARGPVLAISSNCVNKDAAWDFIAQCLSKSSQKELPSCFPLCRQALEEQLEEAMQIEYETDENGVQKPLAKDQVIFEGEEPVDIYCISQDQADQLITLITSAEISSTIDPKLYNIFWEEVAYYFSGSKGLEETAEVIQSRAEMYVNERIK